MGELIPTVRPPAASHVKEDLLLFLGGWGLGLLPLGLGLSLAVWGIGFLRPLGVLMVGASPFIDVVGVMTLLGNAAPRWLWIGTLFGLFCSTIVVVIAIMPLLKAL